MSYSFEMTDTATESRVNGVKLMVYGDAGMGKTSLVPTLPTPFLISAESGLLSLAPQNIDRIHPNDPSVSRNVPVLKVRNMAEFRDAVRWAQESHEATQFESGAVDSATEIFEQILKEQKVQNADGRAAYGAMHAEAITLLKNFRDIPGLNVYMSSKMAKVQNPITGFTKCAPMAPGKNLTWDIPYLFDMMFALRLGEDEQGTWRYLQTAPCLQFEAKDRSGACLASEEPHLGRIIEKIKASNYDERDWSTHVFQEVDTSAEGGYSE